MKPYSEDLRHRVVEAVDAGMPRVEVVRVFAVSLPTIKRWLKRRREVGELAAKRVSGPSAMKTAGLAEALRERLVEHPDASLDEHRAWWQETSGFTVSRATMSRAKSAIRRMRKRFGPTTRASTPKLHP